jgi:hypothetical protein
MDGHTLHDTSAAVTSKATLHSPEQSSTPAWEYREPPKRAEDTKSTKSYFQINYPRVRINP